MADLPAMLDDVVVPAPSPEAEALDAWSRLRLRCLGSAYAPPPAAECRAGHRRLVSRLRPAVDGMSRRH